MNKKGKTLFKVILSLLLCLLSITALSLYDNARYSNINKYEDIDRYYKSELQLFTIDLAKQLNPEYVPLEIKDLAEKKELEIQRCFDDSLMNNRSFINMDKSFYYIARNTITNEVITNAKDFQGNIESNDYYLHIQYDSDGLCKLDGDITRDIFSNLNKYKPVYFENNNITINNPTNLEIEYFIPNYVKSNIGISGYINSWEHYDTFVITLLAVLGVIVGIFVLIYPIKYVKEAEPFRTIKEWNIEAAIIIFVTCLTLLVFSLSFVVGNTINGNLENQLLQFGIVYIKQIELAINIFMWLITLLFLAVASFVFKYIIVLRPINYLKKHSFIIKSIFNTINKFRIINDIDFSKPINLKLLKYLTANAIIIIVMGLFNPITIIFTLIYSIVLFIIFRKTNIKIQDDYNTLISAIKNIISEDFDKISEKDFGIFEDSKYELNQLSENFELAIQEKVRSQKLKTELISNVSHDLKTPLTCIKNYIALLKDDKLSEDERKYYVEQLSIYSNRLKNLIDDLFEISKVDSGNINLNLQELDIVSLLDQVHMENEELLEPKGLCVIKKYSVEKLILNLDSDKTYRIFENLFTNISKYALSNSRVYISLVEREKDVCIEFSNISEVPMDFNSEEITERFVRGDKSRSKQGTGLGLAIARSFTEAQGGNFNISIDCDLFKVIISFSK